MFQIFSEVNNGMIMSAYAYYRTGMVLFNKNAFSECYGYTQYLPVQRSIFYTAYLKKKT